MSVILAILFVGFIVFVIYERKKNKTIHDKRMHLEELFKSEKTNYVEHEELFQEGKAYRIKKDCLGHYAGEEWVLYRKGYEVYYSTEHYCFHGTPPNTQRQFALSFMEGYVSDEEKYIRKHFDEFFEEIDLP